MKKNESTKKQLKVRVRSSVVAGVVGRSPTIDAARLPFIKWMASALDPIAKK